jgi:hypothetical protein
MAVTVFIDLEILERGKPFPALRAKAFDVGFAKVIERVAPLGPAHLRGVGIDLVVVGDGIDAQSSAAAVATVNQKADQTNSISQSATGGNGSDINQTQADIRQSNHNDQDGDATALATSYNVDVVSDGNINAQVDGIDAVSSAVAVATVDQEVNQQNTTRQDASAGTKSTIDQTQASDQTNANEQDGTAIAVGVAGDVTVTSDGNIEPVNGIVAESTAAAVATVDQTADQSNTSGATASTGDFSNIKTNVTADQTNSNEQDGDAIAVATSGEVNVVQNGNISASDVGISADSTAVAVATVKQEANQENLGFLQFDVGGPNSTLTATLSVDSNNTNEQDGDAIAVALAEDVSVEQDGNIKAGGNGIERIRQSASVAEACVSLGRGIRALMFCI